MILVKYFIPEDGDEEEHPNVLYLKDHCKDGKELTLRDIKKCFPLPGNYHFRFLTILGQYTVWLDASNDDDVVPLHKGSYFSKVTRLLVDEVSSGIDSNSIKRVPESHKTSTNLPKSIPQVASLPQPTTKSVVSSSSSAVPSEKLLKFDDDGDEDFSTFSAAPPIPSTTASLLEEDDLLGMDFSSGPIAAVPKVKGSAVDLLGLDALKPSTVVPPARPQRPIAITQSSPHSPLPPKPSTSLGQGQGSASMLSGGMRSMGGMGSSSSSGNLMLGRGGPIPPSHGQGQGQAPMGNRGASYDPFNDLTGLNANQKPQSRR